MSCSLAIFLEVSFVVFVVQEDPFFVKLLNWLFLSLAAFEVEHLEFL